MIINRDVESILFVESRRERLSTLWGQSGGTMELNRAFLLGVGNEIVQRGRGDLISQARDRFTKIEQIRKVSNCVIII